MNARRFLRRLDAAGFSMRVDGDRLAVSPKANLTAWTRELIGEHKSELLDLLEIGVEFESPPPCVDCGVDLLIGGVRCPDCRDALDASACASCGAVVPTPRLSAVCSLCSLEAAVLAAAEPDPPSREEKPEPGTCRRCGTTTIGPSATICGRCRRKRWEEEP